MQAPAGEKKSTKVSPERIELCTKFSFVASNGLYGLAKGVQHLESCGEVEMTRHSGCADVAGNSAGLDRVSDRSRGIALSQTALLALPRPHRKQPHQLFVSSKCLTVQRQFKQCQMICNARHSRTKQLSTEARGRSRTIDSKFNPFS